LVAIEMISSDTTIGPFLMKVIIHDY